MFQQSWYAAEKVLASAQRWVFIGYSLPAADYEFKCLLKRIELSRGKPPDIILVTGGDESQTGNERTRDGGVILITQFIGLLLTFIGEGLTSRLVQDVWPEARLPRPRSSRPR